jgi:pyridinium-3,5-bisthiocarboxylic acid mononucleotide nickel chelatase
MSILKIEGFSGLSGDMFLGSLAELTNSYDELVQLPLKLHLKNVEVKISEVEKNGIACKHIKIIDNNEYQESNHNLLSQLHHNHIHNHDHENFVIHQEKHSHHHRHLKNIYKIIENAELSNRAKEISKKIFLLLGEAESKVHGVDINSIHFHEVGAIDSILDIVGSAFLIDKLDVQKTYVTDIRTGKGFAVTEHGKLPIPCPATKELLLGFPTYSGDVEGEMTTPTGAAILKYLNPDFNIPALIEEKTGYGPGEKNFNHPNVLRLSLCKSKLENQENIFLVETNIDDMSSEVIGLDFQQQLLEKGALDFYFTQVIMKKGRPGLLVSVLVNKKNVSSISDFILENTTSIGLRYYPVSRNILNRDIKEINTSLGKIKVKEVVLPSGKKRITPEYDSCATIAKEKKIPITQIFSLVNSEINN